MIGEYPVEPTTTLTLTEREVTMLFNLLGDMPNKSGTFDLMRKIMEQHNAQDAERQKAALLAEMEQSGEP